MAPPLSFIFCTASKAFEISIASATAATTSSSGLTVKADMDFESAHAELPDFDVVVVPGASDTAAVLASEAEPLALIGAFAALQQTDPSRERTLVGVCTGALLLARAGVLQGLAATTHPDAYTRLEIVCKDAARRGDLAQTDVMEGARYVVNHARFDLGGDNWETENPFVLSRPPPPNARQKSGAVARKGSNAWRESNTRRESVQRRAGLRLGGLRVITSAGASSGIDAALYLVAALVSHESALEVARVLQYSWTKGVTVDGIDV